MTNVTIRSANLMDAVRLAELSELLGYPVEAATIKARLERLLSKPDHIVVVAELPSSGIAGWTHAAEHDILEIGRSCEILGLVVDADQRNQGVGRQLIEHVEQWAVKRGFEQMSVRSNILRTESHPFYERMGYTRVRTQHAYRKEVKMLNDELLITDY